MSALKIIETHAEFEEMLHYALSTKIASHDWETSSLHFYSDNEYPLCLGTSFQRGGSWVLPLGHSESPFKKRSTYEKMIRIYGHEIISNPDIMKIAWNMKFEKKWFMRYGVFYKGYCADAMLAKYCLEEERPHDLKSTVDYIFPAYEGYEDSFKDKNFKDKPLDKLVEYCGKDCDLTLRLMDYFEPKLIEGDYYTLFRNLLMMASHVLSESEYRGMLVDRPYLEKTMEKFRGLIKDSDTKLRNTPSLLKFEQKFKKDRIKKMIKEIQLEIAEIENGDKPTKARLIKTREEKINRLAKGQLTTKKERYDGFNFASVDQLREFFFNSKYGLRLPIIKYTKDKFKRETKKASTDEEVIEALKKEDKSGFMQNLLDFRGLAKLDSTYISGVYPLLDHADRIHCGFKINGTVTGRLSCSDPNLQNIPRTTTSTDVKPMFIPPPGFLLLEVDYSQAELRIVAELAKDKAMIDIFARNYNIHVATACKANKALDRYDEIKKIIKIGEAMDPIELKKKENKDYLYWVKEKKKAKTINFGILYGQGDEKLADGMECSVEEAKEFRLAWFEAYPQVVKWINKQKKFAKKNEYVPMLFGRRRRLYGINDSNKGVAAEAERQSVNAPIQGTASDFGLLAQIVIRDKITTGEYPIDMMHVYTVHDSIGYYIRPKDIHWVVPKIVAVCANPDTMKYFNFELKHVTMKVSPEVGKNWGDLTEYDEKEDYTKWLN